MGEPRMPAEWRHRGCRVRLEEQGFLVFHPSGLPLGHVVTLPEARQLIDERIVLLRQRLAAAA